MAETKREIGFHPAGIGTFLKHNHLVVEPHQREYAWRIPEVIQLFDDFAKSLNSGEHFLGIIVTIPLGGTRLQVVDGQQRLATTAMLLAAIRDYLVDKGAEIDRSAMFVESINTEFLTEIDRDQFERVPTLKLNVDDNELFSKIITGDPVGGAYRSSRESHQRIMAAFTEAKKRVRSIVAGLDVKHHGGLLNTWVSFIEDRAFAILIRVPDTSSAFNMFETLNARGQETSKADLIKNHLFEHAGGRFNEVQAKWSYMRGALETLKEKEITITFLRHALIVNQGFLRKDNLYDVAKEMIWSEQSAVTFASLMEDLSNSYVASFNRDHARWNDYEDSVRRAIEVFNLLDIRPLRPLILAITYRMSPKETDKAFQFLVSFGVRLLIASSTRTGSVEETLAQAAHEVSKGEVDTAAKLRQRLERITPTDYDFQRAFEDTKVSEGELARYYLRSLEMTRKGERTPYFIPYNDRSVINLEHILPRKPEGNWPQFDEEIVRAYTTRLGNLALMQARENSKLKSDNFATKKPVFRASPYELTSEIAQYDEWTTESIEDRQRRMAKLAVKTWPIKG